MTSSPASLRLPWDRLGKAAQVSTMESHLPTVEVSPRLFTTFIYRSLYTLPSGSPAWLSVLLCVGVLSIQDVQACTVAP